MAEEANPFSTLSFSDNTGNTELLDTFLSDSSITEDPAKIKTIEQDDKDKEEKKKSEETKKAEKAAALAKAKQEADEAKNKALKDIFDTGEEEQEEREEEEEEQPKKVKKEVKTKTEDSEEGTKVETNVFTDLSKELFDLGVFSKDADDEQIDIDSPEKFLGRFNYESEKKANQKIENFIGRFGEDYQQAFEAIYINGADPKEYFTTYNEIVDLANLDLKVEANQESVVKQELQERGYEAEDIKVKLERIKNNGDLEDEANRAHKVLVKNQTAKLAKVEETKKAQLQQQAAVKQQYITNVNNTLKDKVKNKEFDGIPINPTIAQELQDYLITDKWRTPSGENLTDFDKFILDLKKPENHQMKVKVALLFKTLEKDPTLKTIQKAGISKESNTLFKNLAFKKEKSSVKESKASIFGEGL